MRIVVAPDVDGASLAATLTRRLKECVASSINESVNELLEYVDNGLQLDCVQEEILLTASEYRAQREAVMQTLRGSIYGLDSTFDVIIDSHPDNGKCGMWLVSGIRHACVVNGVHTARDALDRAIANGEISSWEYPTFKYLDPNGPEVFPV